MLAEYHKLAYYYDEFQSAEDLQIRIDLILEKIRQYLKNSPHVTSVQIADLGCGTGLFSLSLLKRGLRISAVDISEQMLDLVRTKTDSLPTVLKKNLQIIQADLSEYIFPEKQDVLLAMTDTLNHLDSVQLNKAFLTAGKNIRPGGLFFFDLLKYEFFATERGDQTIFVELGSDNVDPEMSMIWENEWLAEDKLAISNFTFFEKDENKKYKRTTDQIVEYYHDLNTIEQTWQNSFSCLEIIDYPERKLYLLKRNE